MSLHTETQPGVISWWQQTAQRTLLWLFAGILTFGLTLILSFNLVRPSNVPVVVGQPAPTDILAPRSVTYTSEVLTEQAREQARNSVPEQYTSFDLSIGRAQLDLARAVFAFVETVRADTFASVETKVAYLQAVEGLNIEQPVALNLLELDAADYEVVKAEVLAIIDELMRQEIRPEQLSAYQRSARRPSLVLTPTQENVVTNLAHQFIVPTVFPNEEATARRREEAAAAVEPVVRTITEGTRVVRAGDIITSTDIETLTRLGLLQQSTDWRDVGSIFIASLLTVVVITLYWEQFYRRRKEYSRYLLALLLLILFFALVAKIMLVGPSFVIYWFPIAAMSMLLAVIFDVRLAIIVTVVMAALIGYVAQNSLEISTYIAAGGLMSVLTLRDAHRVNAFFRAGLVAAVGHVAAILIFRLPQDVAVVVLLQQVLYGLGNGILSAALTLAGFFIIGSLFGVITILQLQELSRLDHPLLQELLRRAPGTYHHSIMVANLAEQAAERIKANSALVRVGAFYHDIGKMNRPPFFTENQEGVNPHDSLDPYSSARIIVSHVSDGLELARRYRLPDRIRHFIAEHHGDRVVKGFYMKAREQAGEEAEQVNVEQFKHRGPRPQSRETGIVMLADAVEAASSAVRPNTEKAIEKLVNSLVDEHVTEGQLNESELTLGDIKFIRASFIETLKGRYHMRVKYPGNEQITAENAPAPPVPAVNPQTGLPVHSDIIT